MPDFWRASGYHLLDHGAGNRLLVTDDLLRAYLRRPEIRPIDESCPAERALHAELLEAPRRAIPDVRIGLLADPDARDNYRVFLPFRDRLINAPCLEAAYLGLFRDGPVTVPPLFVDQLAHMLVRHLLEGCEDAIRVRTGELFFRQQNVAQEDGAIMLADSETVDMHARTGGLGDIGRLLVESGTPPRAIELDILSKDNAERYWARDERHDMVLDLTFARPGLDALCRLLESWVVHFLGTAVTIHPVQKISDEKWVWHVGLDVEATALLNDLYEGKSVEEARMARLLSLFRLEFVNPGDMRPDLAGRPVYLGLCASPTKTLRLKPQNLLVNLPIARPVS